MTARRPDWLTFRRFAAWTTELTLTLILLGIYTSATGSGLACSQQWPLCDGGVLPRTIPSFIEWIHRLDAMITGFFILGTALWSWRAPVDRKTRLAATGALALLPLQIGIGAVTVTLNGALPSGYSVPTHAAHLLAALAIFTLLSLTALWARDGHHRRPPHRRARVALAAAAALVPASAVLSRVGPLVAYAPAVQSAFVGVSLAAFVAAVAATVWLGRTDDARLRLATVPALALLLGCMLLGRDLVYYSPTVRTVNAALFAGAFALLGVAALIARRHGRRGTDRAPGAAGGE